LGIGFLLEKRSLSPELFLNIALINGVFTAFDVTHLQFTGTGKGRKWDRTPNTTDVILQVIFISLLVGRYGN